MSHMTAKVQARNIARARAAIVRDRKLTLSALRDELAWAREQETSGPVKDHPIWSQVAADLERVLKHRGGSPTPSNSSSVLTLVVDGD